jgi:hypothetical protein
VTPPETSTGKRIPGSVVESSTTRRQAISTGSASSRPIPSRPIARRSERGAAGPEPALLEPRDCSASLRPRPRDRAAPARGPVASRVAAAPCEAAAPLTVAAVGREPGAGGCEAGSGGRVGMLCCRSARHESCARAVWRSYQACRRAATLRRQAYRAPRALPAPRLA